MAEHISSRSERFSSAPSIHENLTDPVGAFLREHHAPGTGSDIRIPTKFIETMSAARRAESMWALYQYIKNNTAIFRRHQADSDSAKPQQDPAINVRMQMLAQFYADPQTREAYAAAYERHTTERLSINGSYMRYQRAEQDYESATRAYDDTAATMFGKRGSVTDEFDVIMLESTKHVLAEKRAEIEHLENARPEVGALVHFDTLRRYNSQLSREKFIWSPSRRQYLEAIEEAALGGKPLLLSGQSGTGKTELAKAAARKLTGREANATPGKDVRMQDLIAQPKIAPLGGTYYEYKEIGQAVTGKENTLTSQIEHNGRFVLDDEFNLLDTAEQTTRLGAVASWKPGTRIRMPVTNEEVTVAPKFLYVAMANLASGRYSRQKMEAPVLRKFAMIDVDYPEQSAQNPEIFDMMMAALMDENGRMLAAESEIAPHYSFAVETRTEKIHGLDTVRQVRARHFDAGSDEHGFLWRFAESIHQINLSFSEKETVLKTLGKAQFVKDLMIDMGTILGWLTNYRRLGRTRSLESYISEQIHNQFTSKAAYTAEDRKLVTDFFGHFGIDVKPNREEIALPEFQVMTPAQVGRLSPSVTHYEIIKEEVKLETIVYITDDGERILYKKQNFESSEFGRLIPDGGVQLKNGSLMQFLGVRVDTGEPLLVPPRAAKPIPPPPPTPERRRDAFHGIKESEARRLGLEKAELLGNPWVH